MTVATLDTVEPGTWVRVRGLVPGAETVVHFVPDAEVNYFEHKLPAGSLLGEALLGARVGDAVDLGNDQMELTVLEMGRE
jgi:transcription elongation GreA/GreB family factor